MNIGIIGFGDGGKSNFRGAILIGVKVVAICDPIVSIKEYLQLNDNVAMYTDPLKLIDRNDIDLIIIATPDDQHLSLLKESLKRGKYVFVEKPVAINLKEINEIELMSKKYKKQILFSEKYSYSPIIKKTLDYDNEIGNYTCGSTFYVMSYCDRIMGEGKWRTESAYNPCAGGLSHNFMTALLFSKSPIKRIQSIGQILNYHKNLDKYGGYDYMSGLLQYENGTYLSWMVNLSNKNNSGWNGHRTISHYLQFSNGSLAYGPKSQTDKLVVSGCEQEVPQEPEKEKWDDFSDRLYAPMLTNVIDSINGKPALHNIKQGINVAKACALAFESAKLDGKWMSAVN